MRRSLFSAVLGTALMLPTAVRAQMSDDEVDQAALKDLDQFLNDPAARRSFAATKPDAKAANTYLEKFPDWAQTELLAIVMAVMKEKKAGAVAHVNAHKSGGAAAAKASFSPAVQSRVEALERRLASDPAFNNPANMAMMKSFIPAFVSAPGS